MGMAFVVDCDQPDLFRCSNFLMIVGPKNLCSSRRGSSQVVRQTSKLT